MGAWGTGIFQDDTACDVRDDYRRHLGDGLTGPEATAKIVRDYATSSKDREESGVVWLALAATQWRCGRLEPETLENALRVIASGSDLARWKDAGPGYDRRAAALEKLRTQITSPQPEPKKIRRQVAATCDWRVGELISYRLLSGRLILLRVIGHHTDKGGVNPNCEILDWAGDMIPALDELRSVPSRKGSVGKWRGEVSRLMLLGTRKTVNDRLHRLDKTLSPEQKSVPPITVVLWKELDTKLADWFGLK